MNKDAERRREEHRRLVRDLQSTDPRTKREAQWRLESYSAHPDSDPDGRQLFIEGRRKEYQAAELKRQRDRISGKAPRTVATVEENGAAPQPRPLVDGRRLTGPELREVLAARGLELPVDSVQTLDTEHPARMPLGVAAQRVRRAQEQARLEQERERVLQLQAGAIDARNVSASEAHRRLEEMGLAKRDYGNTYFVDGVDLPIVEKKVEMSPEERRKYEEGRAMRSVQRKLQKWKEEGRTVDVRHFNDLEWAQYQKLRGYDLTGGTGAGTRIADEKIGQ